MLYIREPKNKPPFNKAKLKTIQSYYNTFKFMFEPGFDKTARLRIGKELFALIDGEILKNQKMLITDGIFNFVTTDSPIVVDNIPIKFNKTICTNDYKTGEHTVGRTNMIYLLEEAFYQGLINSFDDFLNFCYTFDYRIYALKKENNNVDEFINSNRIRLLNDPIKFISWAYKEFGIEKLYGLEQKYGTGSLYKISCIIEPGESINYPYEWEKG